MNITYEEIISASPRGDEDMMHRSVEHISELLEEMDKVCPDKVRHFIMEEYEMLNGRHFNEALAKDEVRRMFHYTKGDDMVEGEMFSMDEAEKAAGAYNKYDVYVAVNGHLHDYARTDLTNEQIMNAAMEFWFNDDDGFPDNDKVWWYYSNK